MYYWYIKLRVIFFVFMAYVFFVLFMNPAIGRTALIFEGQLYAGKRLISVGDTVAMTLRIYNDEFSGEILFEESQEIAVGARFSCFEFEKGKISVKKHLSGIPTEKLWVEVECDNKTMTPRLSLAELGSLNELTAGNSSIKDAHLRTSSSATLVINNDGVTFGGTLDMGGEAIKLGGISRTSWPSGSSSDLEARVAALETLLQHFSRTGNDITISGANLHLNNGSGSTNGSVNGLGNLIIGYNEARDTGEGSDDRTGSHNLIIGRKNNYSSYGGLVVGYINTISGRYASISGGDHNVASGHFSSILGGYNNTASGTDSNVSGGFSNKASADSSSVSGGENNLASAAGACVSGGYSNEAKGQYSSVSGGRSNMASVYYASVSGGWYNSASGNYSSVSGGASNVARGESSSVYGGHNEVAEDQYDYEP